jgi:hypothetical protein
VLLLHAFGGISRQTFSQKFDCSRDRETNGVFTPEKEMSAAEACDEDGSSASNSGGSSEQRNQQFQHGGAVRRLSKQISSHIMEMFDRSGLYYWCPPRSIDDADIVS